MSCLKCITDVSKYKVSDGCPVFGGISSCIEGDVEVFLRILRNDGNYWVQKYLIWTQKFLTWAQIFLTWAQIFLAWPQIFLAWAQKYPYMDAEIPQTDDGNKIREAKIPPLH